MRSSHFFRVLPLLLALLWAPSADATAPGHRWRTAESAHFVLHFHEGLHDLAQRALRSLEEAHLRLVPFFGEGPKAKTQVVLTDHTDEANGSATAFGRPQIVLHAAPPGDLSLLGDFDDWLFILVAHEYAHILHLGTTGGPTDLLTRLFGNLFNTNAMQPRFLVEGLATYHESLFSSGGRMRSALAEMYLRADFLEDRVLTPGQLAGGPLRWPRGTAWYLYGGSFLSYLASSRGDEVIRGYSERYGSSVLPYLIEPHLEASAQAPFSVLWEEWKETTRLKYMGQAQVVELRGPVTEPTWRTSWGARTGAPRWTPDGTGLLYVEASEDRRPRLRRLDVATGADVAVSTLGGVGAIAPLPDGTVLLSRPELFDGYRLHGDLFQVDSGGETRRSRGLRASEVDVAPDGSFAVYVRRHLGETTLMRWDLLQEGEPRLLYAPPPGRQVHTPRIDPAGERVVFSQDRAGAGRDLFVLSLGGGTPQRLTDDAANDLQPSWAPGGDRILFSSDRDGIFNVYGVGVDGSALLRLTNVVTGAFQPSLAPDGRHLAWVTYSSRGYDVAVAPVESLQSGAVVSFTSDRPSAPERVDGPIYPVAPYRPLRHLGVLAWTPTYSLGSELVLGATVWGRDPAAIHAWELSAGYGFDTRQPQLGLSYRYGNWAIAPSVALASGERRIATDEDLFERVTTGALSFDRPFGTLRVPQRISLGYQASLFHEPRGRGDVLRPIEGVATEARGSWGISTTERPPDSISPEDGISLSLLGRLGAKALGGDFDYRIASMQAGAYLRLPWAKHHVLALLGRGGISGGDIGGRGAFSLGGPALEATVVDALLRLGLLGETMLRGYAPASFQGQHLLLGTAEYRFPLAWLDAAPGLLPLYVGKLSGTLFAEAGDAFDELGKVRLHPAAGAELRLSFHLGWGAIDGALRLGTAWGFDRSEGGGLHPYLGLGASF